MTGDQTFDRFAGGDAIAVVAADNVADAAGVLGVLYDRAAGGEADGIGGDTLYRADELARLVLATAAWEPDAGDLDKALRYAATGAVDENGRLDSVLLLTRCCELAAAIDLFTDGVSGPIAWCWPGPRAVSQTRLENPAAYADIDMDGPAADCLFMGLPLAELPGFQPGPASPQAVANAVPSDWAWDWDGVAGDNAAVYHALDDDVQPGEARIPGLRAAVERGLVSRRQCAMLWAIEISNAPPGDDGPHTLAAAQTLTLPHVDRWSGLPNRAAWQGAAPLPPVGPVLGVGACMGDTLLEQAAVATRRERLGADAYEAAVLVRNAVLTADSDDDCDEKGDWSYGD